MARYTTKRDVLEAIQFERNLLESKFRRLTPKEMVWPGSMGEWSVKDILAHLVDWEQRFIGWYEAGRRGEVPQTPAPGMTWRDLPRLNQQGFERHRDRPLPEILAEFQSSHRQIVRLVEEMPEEEILTPGYYAWTRKASLAGWIAANTCEHYRWARRMIRSNKIRQECAAEAAAGALGGREG